MINCFFKLIAASRGFAWTGFLFTQITMWAVAQKTVWLCHSCRLYYVMFLITNDFHVSCFNVQQTVNDWLSQLLHYIISNLTAYITQTTVCTLRYLHRIQNRFCFYNVFPVYLNNNNQRNMDEREVCIAKHRKEKKELQGISVL